MVKRSLTGRTSDLPPIFRGNQKRREKWAVLVFHAHDDLIAMAQEHGPVDKAIATDLLVKAIAIVNKRYWNATELPE